MLISTLKNGWYNKTRSFGMSLLIIFSQVAPFLALTQRASAVVEDYVVDGKIQICHRTDSASNPYTFPEVAVEAADGLAGNSNQTPDHYGEHTGGVFDPSIHNQKNRTWGDIIPPIIGVHSGLNWTLEGQAIWENDCEVDLDKGFIKVYKEVDLGDGKGFVEDNPSSYGFKWGIDDEVPARAFGSSSEELVKDFGPFTISENNIAGYEYVGWYDGNNNSCENPDGVTFPEIAITKNKTRHITLCNKKTDIPEVDFCDPDDRPRGMSIAEWFKANQFDGAECFELEPVKSCGMFDIKFNDLTGLGFEVRYVEGDDTPDLADWEGDGALPVIFNEDYNDGSIELTYYIVGPESDYLEGSSLPNIWDSNGETVVVDTDCEEPEPEPSKITVIKEVDDGPLDENFNFEIFYGESSDTFELNGDKNNEKVYEELYSDHFRIEELLTEAQLEDGWELDDIDCESSLEDFDYDEDDNFVEFNLREAEHVTCVFENDRDTGGGGGPIPGSIVGYKLNDANANTREDNGEQRLAGWKINLYAKCEQQEVSLTRIVNVNLFEQDECDEYRLIDTTVTGIDGNYRFDELWAGEYRVCEVMQKGWVSTYANEAVCVDVFVSNNKDCIANFYNMQIPKEPKTPGRVLGISTPTPVPQVLAETGVNTMVNIFAGLFVMGSVGALFRLNRALDLE